MVRDSEGNEIQTGDVVRIDPEHDERFGACMLVVSELKPSWNGMQGYVKIPGGGEAYYRVEGSKVVRVGAAQWVHQHHDEA